MNSTGRRHFHTFDALRFFAFLKVFLLHLPIYAFPWFSFLKLGGNIGVQFFFVLSGFLITYIICEEKMRTGTLDLKKFFARRILRIWPLYYLLVALAYLIPYLSSQYLGHTPTADGYKPNIWISALFIENYKIMATNQMPQSSLLLVMWTLCIEEQFYIIWALLLYYLPVKKLPIVFGICLITALILRSIYVFNNIPTCDVFSNIDLFAFGAIPAYLLVTKPVEIIKKINDIKFSKKIIYIVFVVAFVVVASYYMGVGRHSIWLTTLLGIIFSMLILLLLPENSRLKISDSNVLSRTGGFTYGLYLYHIIVINLLLQIFKKNHWGLNTAGTAIAFTSIALGLSALASFFSYHLFEKHFLKLKKYFR